MSHEWGTPYEPRKLDLRLDDAHYIIWVEYEGERCGGILGHRSDKVENPYFQGHCEGAFWFERNKFHQKYPQESVTTWKFNGDFDQPTLSPSFLCHCKECHIFIVDGKVKDAGCTHPKK